VKIFHSVEGGDVKHWLEPQNISLCLRLNLTCIFILFTYLQVFLVLRLVFA